MSRTCQGTGTGPQFGHRVSHSRCRPGRTVLRARGDHLRPVVRLRSTAGTGFTCVTRKNQRTDPDRMVLSTYAPRVRRHVDVLEERW